jgi:hypothetical protein
MAGASRVILRQIECCELPYGADEAMLDLDVTAFAESFKGLPKTFPDMSILSSVGISIRQVKTSPPISLLDISMLTRQGIQHSSSGRDPVRLLEAVRTKCVSDQTELVDCSYLHQKRT